MTTYANGQRVRLLHDVDRYPHFIAAKGATGTVVSTPGADPSGTLCVRMDWTIAGAEDWDNEIVWSIGDGDDPLRDFTMLCRECGNEIEPHLSGLCDSCETQAVYDRAADPSADVLRNLDLSTGDLRFIAENLDFLAGIDEGENTDFDRLTSLARIIEAHLAKVEPKS